MFCFLAGQGTRTGATDQGVAPGEPAAVHPANGNQGDGAAGRPRGGGGPTCGARERANLSVWVTEAPWLIEATPQ